MKTSTWLFFGLGLACASPAFATLAKVNSIQSIEECGSFSSEVIEEKAYDDFGRGYIGESLRVFFDNFNLTADYPGYVKRNCKLTAEVAVPPGYRFRPTLAAAEGFYNIQPKNQSKGGIKVSYVVRPSGQTAERQNAKPFTDVGDIVCKAELQNPQFSACYNKPHNVALETDLGFWLDQTAGGQSFMQLDATRTKTSLKWNWQFQSCENFWDQKTFSTTYVAYNNSVYNARMTFDLTKGRYDSDAGFTGWFNNVKYSADGLELTADWSTDSQKGWLKLTMSDVSSGKFFGEWGDSSGFKAMWFGSYENSAAAAPKEYYSFQRADRSACLDTASLTSSGSLATSSPCTFDGGQLFYTTNVHKQLFFHIKSKVSGKCLVPSGTSEGSYVESQICGESNLDAWEFYERGKSPFRLKNKGSGLCLAADSYLLKVANCDSNEATWLTWSKSKPASNPASPASPVVNDPQGVSGHPYCGDAAYGSAFNCNGRLCAKADAQFSQVCELKADGLSSSQLLATSGGTSRYPSCGSPFYGKLFGCNGKVCAKSDREFKNMCEIRR